MTPLNGEHARGSRSPGAAGNYARPGPGWPASPIALPQFQNYSESGFRAGWASRNRSSASQLRSIPRRVE